MGNGKTNWLQFNSCREGTQIFKELIYKRKYLKSCHELEGLQVLHSNSPVQFLNFVVIFNNIYKLLTEISFSSSSNSTKGLYEEAENIILDWLALFWGSVVHCLETANALGWKPGPGEQRRTFKLWIKRITHLNHRVIFYNCHP